MICPGRSWKVPVRSWDVLGVHVTSCEYMKSFGRFLEVLGGPGRFLGGSWEVLGGPSRSWEVLEGHGKYWEVIGGHVKSWEVMGGHVSI